MCHTVGVTSDGFLSGKLAAGFSDLEHCSGNGFENLLFGRIDVSPMIGPLIDESCFCPILHMQVRA